MTILYIAGPITGYQNLNRESFSYAAASLIRAGYQVVDPSVHEVDGWTWQDYLKNCLPQLLDCEGVATLPYWQESRGAQLELHVAHAVGILVMPVKRWIEKANG